MMRLLILSVSHTGDGMEGVRGIIILFLTKR
jgi:hypothetical protein